MARRKNLMTTEEHERMAQELYGVRTTLMSAIIRLSTAGPVNGRVASRARQALAKVDALRSAVDDVWYQEIDPTGNKVSSPYYGRGPESLLSKK